MGKVTAWLRLALGTHRCNTKAGHPITDDWCLTGGVGDVHVVVKDAHGKGQLCQFFVRHHHIGLEASILCRTQAGEIHTVSCPPIPLLQVAQMEGHHGDISAPLFQADKHSHTNAVHTSGSHTVRSIDAPVKVRFHASRVIDVVSLTMVSLLKTYDPIQAMLDQFCILLR